MGQPRRWKDGHGGQTGGGACQAEEKCGVGVYRPYRAPASRCGGRGEAAGGVRGRTAARSRHDAGTGVENLRPL